MKNLKFNKKLIATLLLTAELSTIPNISSSDILLNNNLNIGNNVSYYSAEMFSEPQEEWHIEYLSNRSQELIIVAKITGNNVNVRSGPSKRHDVIGFCDITDRFEIIERENNEWYKIKYLNTIGYVSARYVREEEVPNYQFTRHVYLTRESNFYSDTNGSVYTSLPQYQDALVISETRGMYQVMIDGVVGYIEKNNTAMLSNTCAVIDLSRQMLRVYRNNNEIARFHIISGRRSMQSDMGCFRIGHRLREYQLTPDNFVHYWIQYTGNEGIHDASW